MSLRRLTRLAVLGVLACAGPAHAQASADLALAVDVAPSGPLRPGSTAQITLTFSNLGPDDAIGAGAVTSGYEFIVDGKFDLFPIQPNACTAYYDHFNSAPGEPHYLVAAILTGNIPAGSSRVCTLGLFVYPEARGPYELTFRADAATPDPNPTNDLVALNLEFAYPAPATIPATSLGASFCLALAMILGLVAAIRPLGAKQRSACLIRPSNARRSPHLRGR